MGLRTKIIAALLAILSVLALLGSLGLRWEMERSFREHEHAEAIADLRRLLLALDAQLVQLDSILGSWANWTELYEHAKHPNPAFVTRELTPEAIRNGHFDWLVLTTVQGGVLDIIEVPQPDGNVPLTQRLQLDLEVTDWFRSISQRRKDACGLTRVQDRLALMCYRPLMPSSGVGEASGYLIIGRWQDRASLEAARKQTDLDFTINIEPGDDAPRVTDNQIRTSFGHGEPRVVERGSHLDVQFPVASIVGHTLGTLVLHWPRRAHQQALESINKNQAAIILLIALTGALMILVADRMVVAPLQRMRAELARIAETNRWDGHVHVSGRDEIASLGGFINDSLDLIRAQMLELHNLSTTDTLTGLPNRRRFDEELERTLGQFERAGRPLALALLDVDCFKRYNDTYGHPAGDEALRRVAECLRQGARRPGDLPARIGGEEFAVILTDTDMHGARECAEAIRKLLVEAAIPHRTNSAGEVMTLSCGIALAHPGDTQRTLYSRADGALYHAKESGRNRVAVEAPTAAPTQ